MSLTEDFSFFNFKIFLDDYTNNFKSKRRFSENIKIVSKNKKDQFFSEFPKKRCFSLKNYEEEKENFHISNFYPKVEIFLSNEKLYSISSLEEIKLIEQKSVFLEIKKKFCGKIIKNLKNIL